MSLKALANHTHHGSSHHNNRSKAEVLPGKSVYIVLVKKGLLGLSKKARIYLMVGRLPRFFCAGVSAELTAVFSGQPAESLWKRIERTRPRSFTIYTAFVYQDQYLRRLISRMSSL